jgi:hypothetical protein
LAGPGLGYGATKTIPNIAGIGVYYGMNQPGGDYRLMVVADVSRIFHCRHA